MNFYVPKKLNKENTLFHKLNLTQQSCVIHSFMVLQSFIINFELSSLKNSFFSSMAQNTHCIVVIEMGRVLVIVLAFLKGSTMHSLKWKIYNFIN